MSPLKMLWQQQTFDYGSISKLKQSLLIWKEMLLKYLLQY